MRKVSYGTNHFYKKKTKYLTNKYNIKYLNELSGLVKTTAFYCLNEPLQAISKPMSTIGVKKPQK